MEDHDFRVIEARAALAEARKREPGDLTPEEPCQMTPASSVTTASRYSILYGSRVFSRGAACQASTSRGLRVPRGPAGVHSFLATSGPVMRASSGNVAAMMARDTRIPPAVMR